MKKYDVKDANGKIVATGTHKAGLDAYAKAYNTTEQQDVRARLIALSLENSKKK